MRLCPGEKGACGKRKRKESGVRRKARLSQGWGFGGKDGRDAMGQRSLSI